MSAVPPVVPGEQAPAEEIPADQVPAAEEIPAADEVPGEEEIPAADGPAEVPGEEEIPADLPLGDRSESGLGAPAKTAPKRAPRPPEPDRDSVDFSRYAALLERFEGTQVGSKVSELGAKGSLVPVGGLVLAVVLGIWLTSGAWGRRPPNGEDTLAHLARADFAISHLISHGRVDGWHPKFILGYQEFLFIGPGFTWAVFAVRVLTLGLLSTAGAFKVVVIGSFVALPLAVAFCARSMGLSRRSASLAAILVLAVNNPFGGVGVQGLFNVGLVTHQFGSVLFFLALGGVLRVLEDPRRRWIVFTAATLGGLLMSHGISVIILGAVLAVVIPLAMVNVRPLDQTERFRAAVQEKVSAELRARGLSPEDGPPADGSQGPPDEPPRERQDRRQDLRQGIRRLMVAGTGAVGFAACTFLPFVAHRDLRGGYTGWETPPLGMRLSQVWRGDILFRPRVSLLVLAGFAYGLYRVREGRRLALAVAVAPLAYVALSHIALHQWPNVATFQLPNRGIGYAGALAVLPLAALLARVTGPLRRAGDLVALAVAAGIVILPLGPLRDMARQTPEAIPQMHEAARELSRIVPDGARFVTERFFPTEIEMTKVVNPDRWLAWASGRDTLNNFNVESSVTGEAAYQSEYLRDRPPEVIADAVSRLGVTHLVALSDVATQQIGSSPRFRLAWASPPLSIFAVLPRVGQPDPGALITAPVPIQARLVGARPEHLSFDVTSVGTIRADVAVAWSPKWHARVDGRAVPVFKGTDGLIQVDLPAGDHRLTLDFRLDGYDYLGLAITLGTAGLGGRWLWRRRSALPRVERLRRPLRAATWAVIRTVSRIGSRTGARLVRPAPGGSGSGAPR